MRSIKPTTCDGKYIIYEGKRLINLNSNDYLGVAGDTALRKRFLKEYYEKNGAISLASARLLTGTSPVYDDLEDFLVHKLAQGGNTQKNSSINSQKALQKALLFNSGYHANVGIYSSLMGLGDVVFCDKLNHASIIDGIKLGGAKLIPFKHLDYEDLRVKLQKYRAQFKRAIIATESLYSMDGDFFDPAALSKLKKEFDCLLFVDCAHSFCVSHYDAIVQTTEVDLIMGTFGKALGSYGAFCVSDENTIRHLINNARSFIFSTTFPEITAAFTKYVFENGELETRSEKLHALTEALGVKSHIIPIILGGDKKAVQASQTLIEHGFYALPICYPTVSKNSSRVRISLNPAFHKDEVKQAIEILAKGK